MLDTSRPRPLTYVGLVCGGVVLGAVGAVMAAARVTVGSVTIPWGLVLAVLTLVVCVRASVWYAGTRTAGLAVMAGWALPVVAFATVNPGGDVLLPDMPRTYVYLVASAVLGVVAAAWRLPAGAAQLAVDHRAGGIRSPEPDPLEDAAPVPEGPDASGVGPPGR